MSWQEALEVELEVAVADALQDGPADDAAVARARRNMQGVIERWMAEGKIPPPITGYHLHVEGGRGLTIRLDWETSKRPDAVVVDTKPMTR